MAFSAHLATPLGVGHASRALRPSPTQPLHRTRRPTLLQASSGPSVVTDDAVPEGHKDLHSFLYGEGGAEAAHGTAADPGAASATSASTFSAAYSFRDGEDDGTALVPVASYLETREGERPVGVFAVYDAKRNMQYVSYSRNVVLAVRGLSASFGEDRCAFVRVMVFANRAMQSRAALQQEADNWMNEEGTLPPGNGAEAELWTRAQSFDPTSMSADELASYEDKKDKMQRALGEKKQAEEKEMTSDERAAKLRASMEGGDWSAVIDGQTAETLNGNGSNGSSSNGAAPSSSSSPAVVVTPFARASVHRAVGNADADSSPAAARAEMTIASVDKALDDVRPYLIADGGNVEVVSVANGIVALQLQGACGTCPSSTATMKMGIERSLKSAFGAQLKEVINIGGAVDTRATADSLDSHLNILRGAIVAYGGSVEVVDVDEGEAVLRYAGPKPIAYGVVAAVKDKFPDLKEVIVLDKDTGEPLQF